MTRLLRLRRLAIVPILVLGLATMLGGCVAYPYGYGNGYGNGYGDGHGYHAEGWEHRHHDRDRW
jgi:hypothetical protein